MTCTNARNGAPCMAYIPARISMTTASRIAQCTARLAGARAAGSGGLPAAAREHAQQVNGLTGRERRTEAVVVLLGVTEPHRMRRRFHPGLQRRDQLLLGPDQALPVVVRQFVVVGHRQGPGRAGLDAQAAQDAPLVVDLVDGAIPLAGGIPLRLGVFGALDVDGVRRAGPGAQFAADAFLQAVWPAVELVPAVEPRRGRLLLFRVLDGVDLAEHLPEGDRESLDRVEEIK